MLRYVKQNFKPVFIELQKSFVKRGNQMKAIINMSFSAKHCLKRFKKPNTIQRNQRRL